MTRNRTHRFYAAITALTVNGALFAGLAGLFESSAQLPWLTATPDNVARSAACNDVRGTAAHRSCVEQVVADVTGSPVPDAPSVNVALQSSAQE